MIGGDDASHDEADEDNENGREPGVGDGPAGLVRAHKADLVMEEVMKHIGVWGGLLSTSYGRDYKCAAVIREESEGGGKYIAKFISKVGQSTSPTKYPPEGIQEARLQSQPPMTKAKVTSQTGTERAGVQERTTQELHETRLRGLFNRTRPQERVL